MRIAPCPEVGQLLTSPNMKQILLMIALVALAGCHAENKKRAEESQRQSTIVEIANPILEKAIRKAAKKPTGELTEADLDKLTSLHLSRNQLTGVKGLENTSQLKALFLNENKLTKLTGVKGLEKLTQLKQLELSDNQLTDVTGLEKLNRLTWLGLNFNQLTDVKSLENLTQLEELWLAGNQLTDVTGLEKLTQLKELSLIGNQLTEVPKGLEKLTQLKNLYLIGNQLTSVKGLENLDQLKVLSLRNNPDLTKAQIDELKKALPKCDIRSNPTK